MQYFIFIFMLWRGCKFSPELARRSGGCLPGFYAWAFAAHQWRGWCVLIVINGLAVWRTFVGRHRRSASGTFRAAYIFRVRHDTASNYRFKSFASLTGTG
jgi:hypothetical protein